MSEGDAVSDRLPLCSDTARERADPMAGTAAPARRWLLVEHPGPWAVDALAGSGIAPRVVEHLRHAATEAGARVLLVRRPGRRVAVPRRVWAVVDASLGVAAVQGTWGEDVDLLAAARALEEAAAHPSPDDGLGAALPTSGPTSEPWLLVCAHGRHDTCCAVRGRPVAAALAARWPEQTWECSHVGGDRFAANLVVLPEGLYYGGLDPASAEHVVEQHLAGAVDARYLRGSSTDVPVAQAAVVAAHERLGPLPPRALRGTDVVLEEPGRWRVRLAGSGVAPAQLETVVTRTVRAPARLTCRAVGEASAVAYEVGELVDVRVDRQD
ncbi:hypothetical protein GCM10027446_27460 [Angustibacter peucedani]